MAQTSAFTIACLRSRFPRSCGSARIAACREYRSVGRRRVDSWACSEALILLKAAAIHSRPCSRPSHPPHFHVPHLFRVASLFFLTWNENHPHLRSARRHVLGERPELQAVVGVAALNR